MTTAKQPDYVPTVRATMAAGRVKKSIEELEGFDWDYVAQIIDEAITDALKPDQRASQLCGHDYLRDGEWFACSRCGKVSPI